MMRVVIFGQLVFDLSLNNPEKLIIVRCDAIYPLVRVPAIYWGG